MLLPRMRHNSWCWVFAALGGPTETCQAGPQQGERDGTSEPTMMVE